MGKVIHIELGDLHDHMFAIDILRDNPREINIRALNDRLSVLKKRIRDGHLNTSELVEEERVLLILRQAYNDIRPDGFVRITGNTRRR